MNIYTEKYGNTFKVKLEQQGAIHTIGRIEKPYHNMNLYYSTGWNSEGLYNGDSLIFRDFEAAKNRIVSHYLNEMEVIKG
jgi:hypothetical protein